MYLDQVPIPLQKNAPRTVNTVRMVKRMAKLWTPGPLELTLRDTLRMDGWTKTFNYEQQRDSLCCLQIIFVVLVSAINFQLSIDRSES